MDFKNQHNHKEQENKKGDNKNILEDLNEWVINNLRFKKVES